MTYAVNFLPIRPNKVWLRSINDIHTHGSLVKNSLTKYYLEGNVYRGHLVELGNFTCTCRRMQ